jgi:hypothetical protein
MLDLLSDQPEIKMKINYVTNTSGWASWQNDYKYGLILILPPLAVSSIIEPLRSKYDPGSFASAPTHISISDPLRREMSDELDSEIAAILSGIMPFTLNYGRPEASRNHPGVACPITPQAPIDELKQKLHQAAIFEGKVYNRRQIPAHMTIAEFVSLEDSWRICDEVQNLVSPGSFLCDQLEFIVPDINMRFYRVKTYSLGEKL